MILEQKLGIIGAHYDVASGKVHFSDYQEQLKAFDNPRSLDLIQAIKDWYTKFYGKGVKVHSEVADA